ncbi:SDR family oxidoreductase [bacterium]|nr:SDR family oxidoreductase [bacterium]MDA7893589.1 SDR family oxidoreductase [bacterium]MDB4445766.1 SDR family oxidoreductase [bacterium]
MSKLQEVFDCSEPVALVTGSGSRRVGRAIALHLARLGCRIALHANTSVDHAEDLAQHISDEHSKQVIVTQGSLCDDGTPERLVEETVAAFSRIDILVNSAAIWQPTPLEDITASEIRKYFEINSVASFLCAKAAGLQMVTQSSGGSIINIGDWATVRPYLDHAAYFPSKGAIETMTRSLAVELGHRNQRIRVNCIQPGPVLLGEDATEEFAQRMATSTLAGKVGTPEHVAHAAQFLCENDFVTGTCIPVDGGRSIFAPDGIQAGLNSG